MMDHQQHDHPNAGGILDCSTALHQQQQQHAPRLFANLKLALATLYSRPTSGQQIMIGGSSGHSTLAEQAHDFLMLLQSRNTRRKLQSLEQRCRDKQQQQGRRKPQQPSSTEAKGRSDFEDAFVHQGSSWLACLALLCQVSEGANLHTASTTERLFSAQTLLHRIRRTKMVEAIDLEMENFVVEEELQKHYSSSTFAREDDEKIIITAWKKHFHQSCDSDSSVLHSLIPTYQSWIANFHPFVARVVAAYHPPVMTVATDEERAKGELTLLTVAAILYLAAAHATDLTTIAPLLSTLGSLMASTALRLRFSNSSGKSKNTNKVGSSQSAPAIPMINLMIQSLSIVWKTATESATQSSCRVDHDALVIALHSCLGALPEAVLGGQGGAQGRLSIDPACLHAASQELQRNCCQETLLWETLQNGLTDQQKQQSLDNRKSSYTDFLFLTTCEKWAKFLALPWEIVQHNMHLAKFYLDPNGPSRDTKTATAALHFLIAIYEGASWTVDQIITTNLGISEKQQIQQASKKKSSNRSKRRQKEMVDSVTTDSILAAAQQEVHQRGENACRATEQVWEVLCALVRRALSEAAANHIAMPAGSQPQIEGEGPIGCFAECANACLPHLVKNDPARQQDSLGMFVAISDVIQEMCSSPARAVRALTLESLYSLHTTTVSVRKQGLLHEQMKPIVVRHFVKCCMSMASHCGYPAGYFDHLGADSDEDIEIERNDVRDLLRTAAGSEAGGSTSNVDSSRPPLDITLHILKQLLSECTATLSRANEQGHMCPEIAVHALSALAKPLNHLAKTSPQACDSSNREILLLALHGLEILGSLLVDVLNHPREHALILPLARTSNIAVASLSPMISAFCTDNYLQDRALYQRIATVLDVWIRASALSVSHIPELAAPSILDHSQYDIRGAMRSPGGEDHVGCLTLMRLTFDSDSLGRMVATTAAPIIPDLCKLHEQLKAIENKRGQDVFHGEGVCPKSRRILLGVLCRIEVLSDGGAGGSAMLENLLLSAVATTASLKGPWDEKSLFHICENALDITAFSSAVVASLFEPGGTSFDAQSAACLDVLKTAAIWGYRRLSTTAPPDEATFQWNRLRAVIFALIKASANPDIPTRAVPIINALNAAECEAIHQQCLAGPGTSSSIFNDEITSPDGIPAGLFVASIGGIVGQAICSSAKGRNCLDALCASTDFVLGVITLECPDLSSGFVVDPRSTLMESWFLAITNLLAASDREQQLLVQNPGVGKLLVQSCVISISIIFRPIISITQTERKQAPFMCLDGPQSLALLDFLARYFALGTVPLQTAAAELVREIPVDSHNIAQKQQLWCNEHNTPPTPLSIGASIIGAALFRGAQGALPPWALELIPNVFKALWAALDKNEAVFALFLYSSMEVRLSGARAIGSVKPGQLLSGPCFETMTFEAKSNFVSKASALCKQDSWNRLKVVIKQVCGGKKKETDFKQKPSQTRFEFERI